MLKARKVVSGIVWILTTAFLAQLMASSAEAFWRCHRRHYRSYASWGSYGSHGSHGSFGSYGSYGSQGGSWGSYGGSYGSYGGFSVSSVRSNATYRRPTATPDAQRAVVARPRVTSESEQITLAVNVPEKAKVYINDKETTSTGAQRQYVAREVRGSHALTFAVRAEIVRNGQPVTETKTVRLRGGQSAALAFEFATTAEAAESVNTMLALNVPSDATVYLAGNETRQTGNRRVFKTTRLGQGEKWEGYTIRVTVNRDGNLQSREKTITLAAGETREMDFDFSSVAELAAR